MSRRVKGYIESEYQTRFAEVKDCLVVSLRGLSGVQNNELRGDLLSKQIHVSVVKNSLASRAFKDLGREGLGEVLTGPCAIAYGGDSIIDVAKVMMEWSKKLEPLEIKGGFLEGTVLDAQAGKELAKMPNRQELQGMVVGQALSPGSNLAGALGGPAGHIAGCVKTLVEKLEESEAA